MSPVWPRSVAALAATMTFVQSELLTGYVYSWEPTNHVQAEHTGGPVVDCGHEEARRAITDGEDLCCAHTQR